MNELRVNDLFELDPFETSSRGLMRPWRLEGVDKAPQIKIDVSEREDS